MIKGGLKALVRVRVSINRATLTLTLLFNTIKDLY